jgi:drug/metabolite transporter (DMT)-like permease
VTSITNHKSQITNQRFQVIVVWWVTCIIWSTVWLAIKLGVTDVPPFGFAALRLLIAVAVLAPVVIARGRPIAPADRRLIALTGFLLLGVNYALVYWGAQYVSSGLTAILQATTPVFSIVLAHYLLRDEPMTRPRVAAVALGLAGVTLIFWMQAGTSGWSDLPGAAAIVAGAFFVAWAYVLVRKRGTAIDAPTLLAGQMLSGLVPLAILAAAFEGNPVTFAWTPKALMALTYLALAGSVVAFWLNYWLLRRMGATDVLLMAVVEPMIAVALGAVVLGERITGLTVAGSVCILAAVALGLGSRQPGH